MKRFTMNYDKNIITQNALHHYYYPNGNTRGGEFAVGQHKLLDSVDHRLRGNCTYIHGNADGIWGDCTHLNGDVSDMRGCCTGVYGCCTGESGDFSKYKPISISKILDFLWRLILILCVIHILLGVIQ
jgi:hypothetical protein